MTAKQRKILVAMIVRGEAGLEERGGKLYPVTKV
jgi:hypothetical protein